MTINCFQNFPQLLTDRFCLTMPSIDQAADLFAIYGNSEIMKYMQRQPVESIQECEDLIRHWQADFGNHKSIRWAIGFKDQPQQLLGTIALHYWSVKNHKIELGADLNKSYWGQGISTEVTAAVIDFAFAKLEINRLELRCDPQNTASTVIANKFGFTHEGTLREYVFVDGKGFMDEAVYALLKREHCPNLLN